MQFGLGRAGFYSYELLERVTGIPVRNVESVMPTMQTSRHMNVNSRWAAGVSCGMCHFASSNTAQ